MNIRLANMRDLPSVIDILHRVVPFMHRNGNYQWDRVYPSPADFTQDIQQYNLFVAVENRVVIGAVTVDANFPVEYSAVPWNSSPNSYTFHRLMVDPEHHGKGIAEALFRYVEYRGQLMGLRSIRVDTNENNTAVLDLFRKYNYNYVGNVQFRNVLSEFRCYEKTL